VSKKLIIITAAAGLISFSGMFVLAWLTKPSPVSPADELGQHKLDVSDTLAKPGLPKPVGVVATLDDVTRKAMTEKQLKGLIFEVREKMQEYDNKLLTVEQREQRLQIAQDTLKKDIENLNNLRIELASIVASLKEQRDKLLAARVGVAQDEKKNLVKIAATYDKMDSVSAGKILTSMCTKQVQGTNVVWAAESLGDPVKILYYMTERTKAKVLAELVTSEPQLAALLCRKLKQITEEK
jgi:flagellar motility protein MotE (MotC chaperone)